VLILVSLNDLNEIRTLNSTHQQQSYQLNRNTLCASGGLLAFSCFYTFVCLFLFLHVFHYQAVNPARAAIQAARTTWQGGCLRSVMANWHACVGFPLTAVQRRHEDENTEKRRGKKTG
uniref:Uncharacterized protein n=1 Tax=Pundamilia nyererei TaxID=303518 RepID=A0A3B4F1A2_9CICH